jgi:hypothetical protein
MLVVYGKNNYPVGKGAIFGFSLPMRNQNFKNNIQSS